MVVTASLSFGEMAEDAGSRGPSTLDLLIEGNYLGALRARRAALDAGPESWALQELAWQLGTVGCEREAQRAFDRSMGDHPPAPTAADRRRAARAPTCAADRFLVDAVRERPLVVINEAHHRPEHRFLAVPLMKRLADAGLTALALETNSQAGLDRARRTLRLTAAEDYYAMDPCRAELLRAAFACGLEVAAIDHMPEATEREVLADPQRGIPLREAAMASNLAHVVRRHPRGRVLAWVGFSHVAKRPLHGTSWMAARLREHRLDPYCIYQLSPRSTRAKDAYLLKLFALQLAARGGPIAVSGAGSPDPQDPVLGALADLGVDAAILHPRSEAVPPRRPEWRRWPSGGSISGRVTRSGRSLAGHLVQAHRPGEEGTPTDQVVTDQRGRYVLRLPAGTFVLRVSEPAETAGEDRVAIARGLASGEVDARRFAVDEARAEARVAGLRPDPTPTYDRQDIFDEGLAPGFVQDLVKLDQALPARKLRRARRQLGAHQVASAEAAVAVTLRKRELDVRRAFVRALTAQHAITAYAHSLEHVRGLESIISARVAAGESCDYERARIKLAQAQEQDAQDAALVELASRRAELAAAMGSPITTDTPLAGAIAAAVNDSRVIAGRVEAALSALDRAAAAGPCRLLRCTRRAGPGARGLGAGPPRPCRGAGAG